MTEREALDALLDLVREHDLAALSVRVGGSTYEFVAREYRTTASQSTPAPDWEPASGATLPVVPVAAPTTKKITAPIVGVFYRAPAPGTDPFVEVGDRVEVGQVVCILEAMKLMNEITSDFAGIVRRILPENGALVSLGEEMLWIEP